MSELVISVLGSPQITADGVPVEVDTRKAIALLVYVAVSGRPQSRDRLAGLLWPEYDQDKARAALRRTLSALRKALGERWVSADRLAVSLDADGVSVDLLSFRRHLAKVSEHGHAPSEPCPSCSLELEAAVALYGGGFLQGFALRDAEPFEEWQSLEAESVDRSFAGALDALVHAHVATGNLDKALEAAQRKLGLDPLDEPTHKQLMQIFSWKGMRTAALQQYRDCVAILDRELGVSPLAATRALYETISEGSLKATQEASLAPPPTTPSGAAPARALPLRGRGREWEAIKRAYESDPGASVIVVEGEAGIGKTRLARELLALAETRGAPTIAVRSHQGEAGLPYASITDVLGEVLKLSTVENLPRPVRVEAARLVPAFLEDDSPPAPIDDPGALSRFFDGLLRAVTETLRGPHRAVLFLDDLHWSDGASLDVLSYVVRRVGDAPLCIVLSWRTEEVDHDHRLRQLLAEAAQAIPVVEVCPTRLSHMDVHALVNDATELGDEAAEAVASRLMQETEGIPFFVTEYLSVLSADDEADWQMPSTIKDLLRSRTGVVGQTARQVLSAAAVIDRSFDFDTVWRASGRTELETVDALDELVRHGLVSAAADSSYEFSHEKLRDFTYESLSPARRRVLHRRVAEAFIAAGKKQEYAAPMVALIARHLESGGREEEAAIYHEAAAARARDVYANREALDHYLSALALGHPRPAALHEGAADMQVLMGAYQRALDSLEKAAALAAPEDVPGIEHKLGEVHLRRGDYELSQSHFVIALETLQGRGDLVTEARLLAAMSFNAHRKGDLREAITLAERALEAATASGDPRALAQALNQRGILENARGDHAAAAEHLHSSLALAEELDDRAGRAAALNNLALAARSRGELDAALALTQEALKICAAQGDRHREAALRNNLADLLHERGDEEEAMQQLKQATATLAEIGEESTGLLPEVWKLVEW